MSRVLEHFHYLHAIPEPSMQEYKTAAYLATKLQQGGYTVTTGLGGATGVVGFLDSGIAGPTLCLRADMDSLTHIINGVKVQRHTCGHDGHCSMLITAAEEIAAAKLFQKGKLAILFQPSEENGQGALSVIASGLIDKIDLMFGMHVRPIQECAKGEIIVGMQYASCYNVRYTVKGRPCHGARPHLGINPIDAVMNIIAAVNAIHLDPRIPFSVKCTRISADAGTVNSVPEYCYVNFDCRAQSNAAMDELRAKLQSAAEHGASAIGAEIVKVEEVFNLPAAELDVALTKLVQDVVVEKFGTHAAKPVFNTSGGEDFFWYKKKYPRLQVAFAGLGVGCEPGLHHPDMHFDENYLENGVILHKAMVEKILG